MRLGAGIEKARKAEERRREGGREPGRKKRQRQGKREGEKEGGRENIRKRWLSLREKEDNQGRKEVTPPYPLATPRTLRKTSPTIHFRKEG